ncbi:NAD(P)-dependent oxidoreductase [Bartonella vinsonii]|uniref:NAD(P)-dependent oxidoreductase n=1 Tax=Bartonella vinsonii TaxID=33047 RepID=UPI000F8315DF
MKKCIFHLLKVFHYLLEESDVVSLHYPLTKKTAGMINSKVLKKMKKNGILVDTERDKMLNGYH